MDQSEDKSTKTATEQPMEEQSGYILINSSATIEKVIGTEVDTALGPRGEYVTAQAGRAYLIIHMDIENNGCPRFVFDPNHYVAVKDGVEYAPLNITRVIQPRLAILDRVTLRDAGKISGCLIFEVPYSEQIAYTIEYIGLDECKVIINPTTKG